MRKLLIVSLILVSTISTALITHAWFTYVQRKSLVSLVSNEIIVDMKANDELVIDQFILDELAYIDFEDDLVSDLSSVFNQMGTSIDIDIVLNSESPLTRHVIQIDTSHPAMIMLIVYEGVNLESSHQKNTSYYTLLQSIYAPYTTKVDIMNQIDLYNQTVLNDLSLMTMFPGDELSFQLVFWVDYDVIEIPENYLNYTFSITMTIGSVSAKKEVS